jgi:hypothetical protein
MGAFSSLRKPSHRDSARLGDVEGKINSIILPPAGIEEKEST